jgi:hypothetical protein
MSEQLKEAINDLSKLFNELSVEKSLVHNSQYIEFSSAVGGTNIDRGLIWSGDDYNKQLVLKEGNKLFCTESINVARDRNYEINGQIVLSEKELGNSVIKSNLREVGRLRNLSVDGNVTINGYVYYNGAIDRLGLGTDQPNAALSIAEDGIELILGTVDSSKAQIGTFGSHDLEIVTDNTPRLIIDKKGNIDFGSNTNNQITAHVHGKLYVGNKNLDHRVDLQVDGAIKFQDKIHRYDTSFPTVGDFTRGDITWNSEPELGKPIGWVCVRAGSPGAWLPFGEIKHS